MTKFHVFDAMPEQTLADALDAFESEFHYPLGENRWFSISHGDDYTRFFRAIGDARCFVAQREKKVIGVISVARCQLRQPGGDVVEVAYVSDLKVAQPVSGRTLLRLLRDSVAWAQQTPATPGFSIVMDGTARDPTSYTGRLGIPPYVKLSRLMVLRIPCDGFHRDGDWIESSCVDVRDCFRGLTPDHFATGGGDPALRSRLQATGIILNGGGACCILEDTRRCKRLYREDGTEMVSAHLSCFGYRNEDDAVRLLRLAAFRCRELGIPAMFVALPLMKSDAVLNLLPQNDIVKAPATIFGFGLQPGKNWSVNTSEI